MVKNRKKNTGNGESTTNSTPTSSPKFPLKKPPNSILSHKKKSVPSKNPCSVLIDNWKTIIGFICLCVASVFGYLGYLETRVNTPFDSQKMVQRTGIDEPDRYWGSYRPGTYFGLSTRDPNSLVMGMMWYSPQNLGSGGSGIRHWCEIGDNLDKYGWTHHDGKTFGLQTIHDMPFLLETSFIKFPDKKFGGDWTARINVQMANVSKEWPRDFSVVWYVALNEKTNGHLKYVTEEMSSVPGIYGETSGLGEFQMKVHQVKGKVLHKSYVSTVTRSLKDLKEDLFSHFSVVRDKTGKQFITLPGDVTTGQIDPNFIALQLTFDSDFTIDISYQSSSSLTLGGEETSPPVKKEYTKLLSEKVANFDSKFESLYKLKSKNFSEEDISFAKYALSNLIGGIGYFYGASKVQSVYTANPVPYWKAPLYTAVPSRSFFPRGFLWDEGFHGLLISSWDLDIELDIICHWFDLLNVEGWIPREQILGVEALAKVPEEFVIQRNSNANPPTFFLTLRKILTKYKSELSSKRRLDVLERLYPRLQTWFSWFNSTQKGEKAGSYRWRGRDEISQRELNPKTLSSGLDDYPRASHPTSSERHLDLRCWIALASRVMYELSSLLGKDNDIKYYETFAYLTDNKRLNELHLSPYTDTYSDYGLHTDSVVLKRPKPSQENPFENPDLVRVTLNPPDLRFVDSSLGYVSLFPLMLEILDPNSHQLGKILKDLRDPNLLWTDYGIRSLAKNSPLYLKYNTEHDPPYWRAQIWMNMNYLILKALHIYGNDKDGPYAQNAKMIYEELRQNLIKNLLKEYKRTGYIWEQYDDRTGKGKGCYPFTGWSSLILLIMAENY
ncbi:MOGS family protein [Megaselia abdita]